MSNKARIWVITRHYYPIPTGAAIQTHRLLSRIIKHDFDATVMTAALRESTQFRGRELKHDGITIKYIPVLPRIDWGKLLKTPRLIWRILNHFNHVLSKFSFGLLCTWHLTRHSRSGDILLFISSDPFWFVPALVAHLRGIPIVIRMTMADGDDPNTQKQMVRKFKLLHLGNLATYRLANAIIALSTALADDYQQSGQDCDKLVHIPVGVDTHLFHPIERTDRATLRQTLGLEIDRRYILFVGFATPRKGIDIISRAFIWLAQQLDDVDLLLAGQYTFSFDQPGDPVTYEKVLSQLRDELEVNGCASRVHWLGHVDNVEQYFQVADIFCFPSRQEGLPNAVAEALASGIPVVASRLEGITTDLISHEVEGFLLATEQPEGYADTLLRLLNDPTLAQRTSVAGRARVETQFDLDVIAQQYVRLFATLSKPRI